MFIRDEIKTSNTYNQLQNRIAGKRSHKILNRIKIKSPMIGRPSGLSSFCSKGRGEPFERTDINLIDRIKFCKY